MIRSISRPHLCGLAALFTGPMLWPALATAANRYWDGTGTSWDTPAFWSTASGTTTPNPPFKPGAADTAIFNITTVNSAQIVNLDAAQSALGLVFNSTGSVLIQSGAGGPNTLTLGAGGITSNVGAGADTISSPVSLAAQQTWLNDGNKVTVSGDITNGANLLIIDGASATTISGVLGNGSGGLTKNGAGQLVLSNSNTFTGGVTINGGTLGINNPGALNSTTPNALTFGAASTGVLSLNGNSLTLSSLSTNASVGTPIVQNASPTPATLTLNGPGPFDFNGVLRDGSGGGALSLVKSGTGTLFLGGNNTLTGGISVDAGALGVQAGALATIGNLAVGTGMAGSGTVNINGVGSTLTQSGASTLTVGSASGAVGAINVGTTGTGGTLTTGTGLFTINGVVTTVTVGTGATLNANGDVTIDRGLLDVKAAPNTFSLAAGKTFTVQNGGRFTSVNSYSTSTNSIYNIVGSNSKFETSGLFIDDGAQVNVSDGGELITGHLSIDPTSTVTIGSATTTGRLRVGGMAVEGLLQVFNSGNSFVAIHDSHLFFTGRATFDLDGGTFDSSGGPGHPFGGQTFNIVGPNAKWEFVDGSGVIFHNAEVNVQSGLLSAAGNITLESGSPLVISDGGTVIANALIGSGNVFLGGGGATLGITGAAGLTLGPTTLGTSFSVSPAQTLNVTNTTTVPAGASLTINGGTINTSNLVVNGTFSFTSGTLGITGPAGMTVGAGGLFGSTAFFNANQTLHVTNTLTVNSGAYLAVAGGFSAGNLVNNGDVIAVDTAINAPVVNNYQVTVVGSVDFNGPVSGPGDFFGPGTAHFNGGMAPGASPAEVSFEGNLALAVTNTLFIEIGGITPGSQYDRLTVDGSASIDGILNVSLINGFMPAPGQQFTILTAGSIVNNGFMLAGPDVNLFNLLVNSTTVILQAIGLPGDFNHDNKVDAADYVVWRKGVGVASTPENYNLWRTNFGQFASSGSGATGGAPSGSSAPAVPEPSSIILLLAATTVGLVGHRQLRT